MRPVKFSIWPTTLNRYQVLDRFVIQGNQSSKIFNMMKDQNQFHGPCFVDLPTQSKVGDLDPQMGHSTYN